MTKVLNLIKHLISCVLHPPGCSVAAFNLHLCYHRHNYSSMVAGPRQGRDDFCLSLLSDFEGVRKRTEREITHANNPPNRVWQPADVFVKEISCVSWITAGLHSNSAHWNKSGSKSQAAGPAVQVDTVPLWWPSVLAIRLSSVLFIINKHNLTGIRVAEQSPNISEPCFWFLLKVLKKQRNYWQYCHFLFSMILPSQCTKKKKEHAKQSCYCLSSGQTLPCCAGYTMQCNARLLCWCSHAWHITG